VTAESTTPTTAIVLLGGAPLDPSVVGALPVASQVIAADSGAHDAESLGLRVDVVIGDMDSIAPTALAAVRALGTEVVRHPSDKNETDAELALLHAAQLGAKRIIVVSAGGGRLDHQLSLVALLFQDALRNIDVEARIGTARVFPVRDHESRTIASKSGDLVGLLPFGGDAHGVITHGLQWPLHNESLSVTASRGVSNRAVGDHFNVSVQSGRLLVTVDQPEQNKTEA